MTSPPPDVPSFLGRIVDANGVAVGTCFQIEPGVLATACHVVAGLDAGAAGGQVQVGQLAGGAVWPAVVHAVNSVQDLAVLRCDRPLAGSVAGLVAAASVAPATPVVVQGVSDFPNPSGHRFDSTVTTGVWQGSAVRQDGVVVGQLDAAGLVRGMSGGPVRRIGDGMVVGIVSARYNAATPRMRDTVWVARAEDLEPMLAGLSKIRVRQVEVGEVVDVMVDELRATRAIRLRRLRRRLISAAGSVGVALATNVAAGVVQARSWWIAGLIVLGAIAASLFLEDADARRRQLREARVDAPIQRLRSLARDQWRKEAAQLGVTDPRQLSVKLRPAPLDESDQALFEQDLLSVAAGDVAAADGAALAQVWLRHDRLVLLGRNGAGKTELLIAMLIELFRREEPANQVPLLIPIAGWNAATTALDLWLEQWLVTSYEFLADRDADGRTLAKRLLDSNQIAMVLDGLDELPDRTRHEALKKIVAATVAATASAAQPRRILLSSRTDDYHEAARATGQAAVEFPGAACLTVAAPETTDVLYYLRRGAGDPERWNQFSELLAGDAELRALFSTPLKVMLLDRLYNPSPDDEAPDFAILASMPHAAIERLLLGSFLPAAYRPILAGERPNEDDVDYEQIVKVRSERARRFLRQLILFGHESTPNRAGERPGPPELNSHDGDRAVTDIAWWDLGLPVPRTGTTRVMARVAGAAVVFAWTGLSAGLLNGWVFHKLTSGLTDALRIGVAALVCYVVLLALTDRGRAAMVAALGAYIGGVITGSYDLAIAAGLAAGFSWRPLALVRVGTPYAVAVGALAALAPAPVRLAQHYDLVALEPSLTEGFAAGFADGLVSGWDQDITGAIATGTAAALLTMLGMRFTPVQSRARSWRWSGPPLWGLARLPRPGPVTAAVLAGAAVCLISAWGNQVRPKTIHHILLAPFDGLAIALAVWIAATLAHTGASPVRWLWLRRPRYRWLLRVRRTGTQRPALAGLAIAVVIGAAAFAANYAKTDVVADWARAGADAITAGLIVWAVLHARANKGAASVDRAGGLDRRWSHVTALAVTITIGIVATTLYSRSAGWGAAAAYGAALVVILSSRPWWMRWFASSTAAMDGGRIPPLGAGVCALLSLGPITGMPYGLIYALLVGLASKVAAEISDRSMPALRIRRSAPGIIGGALLGGTVAAAASFSGIDVRWIPLVGVSVALAAAFAFGTYGSTPGKTVVMSPRLLLARDRRVFLVSTAVVAGAIGFAVGVRTNAGGQSTTTAVTAALVGLTTYGLTAGLTVAAAQSRFIAYSRDLLILAAQCRLPWRLMRFLDEAYRRGVLRRYGPIYRLRHQEFEDYLVTSEAAPSTRLSTS